MTLRKFLKGFAIAAGCIIAAAVLCVAALFAVLTIKEYRPAPVEAVKVNGTASERISKGDSLTIATWNIGYGALGDNADFFMDGGTHVMTADSNRVMENMSGIINKLKSTDPQIIFLQEVDIKSKRSHYIDQTALLSQAFPYSQNTFATNFDVIFNPVPIPPIGKVYAGIMTLSKFPVTSSERIQLPCPFKWPLRVGNLKRCLMVSRIPVAGSGNELVLVNLHLEAYDSGEGKIAQTNQLKDFIQSEYEKGNYVIAGGDFNQTFSNTGLDDFPVYEGMWQPGIIDIAEFSGDWTFLMDETEASCRSLDRPFLGELKRDFQFYIIDGFIVSGNIKVNSLKTHQMNFVSSDHNPVVMNVTLE
ncbi:MAG: endonuclease/exonuclease/phosphatase family protein [Treponema sp.]|nr:endonuclease/exonuclease/phosphatase family protein [Treponema sp.]